MLKLKSIEEEKKACIKAFEKAQTKIGDMVLHCHHEILFESLRFPYMDRINYIIENKTDNVALRLRLFRPFPKTKNLIKAREAYNKVREAYNKACDDYYIAGDDYYKAHEDFNKACEDFNKACKDYYKTREDYYKACEDYNTTHKPKNDPWNGKTIFANGFELK